MSLDPADWPATRAQAHRMLDDMLDYLERLRQRPVWQPMPAATQALLQQPLSQSGQDLETLHHLFLTHVVPYTVGNPHPGFMGWVHGGGTVVGMLAEMLGGGLNANVGGRYQSPVWMERQIVAWVREWFHFPEQASGLLVTGTSLANLIGVWVALRARLGPDKREQGLGARGARLVAYTSQSAHRCIPQALDLAGLGKNSLHSIPLDSAYRIDLSALRTRLRLDRTAGLEPFLLIGTAGTVDVGAVDNLAELASLCSEEGLWFHVDGAYGALACLSPEQAGLLDGIEHADSIAFDFHKWGQVPYDAGFILVRDQALHRATFATTDNYLQKAPRGTAADPPWPCDYGPDLSRGFRALKTWFTLQHYGTSALGQVIAHTCALAQRLGSTISNHPELELLAPITLNIVCFRYICSAADTVNAEILIQLQESGLAVPSSTRLENRLALRVAIVNHRTEWSDLELMLSAVCRLGRKLTQAPATPPFDQTDTR